MICQSVLFANSELLLNNNIFASEMPHGRGGLEQRACEAHIVNVNGMRIIMIHAHWTTPFFPKSASDSSPIGRLFRLSGDDHDPNGDPESGTRPAPGTAPQPPHLVAQTQARDPF